MKRSGRPSEAPAEAAGRRRTHLLFVCAQNRIRSFTAEQMLRGSPLYAVRSRGVSRAARIRLCASDLAWADIVFVMEKEHKDRIAERFGRKATRQEIVCLYIEDVYEVMEESLMQELRAKLEPHIALA